MVAPGFAPPACDAYKDEVAHSAPHGTERGYSLKILCFRSHVSDREFIQFTAEAWSLKVLTGSRVPSGHSASTSH